MTEEYLKLKQKIRRMLYESVQSNSFEKSEILYYDVAEISNEDSLEIAFDIIYKEGEKDAVYMEETFLENVYERFHKERNCTNINSLKKRIENNNEKSAVNNIYKQLLDLLNNNG